MEKTKLIKKCKLFWKKHWSVIWLFAAVICSVSLIAYAEFDTNKTRLKRVVANVSNGGQLFSSDTLDKSTPIIRTPFSAGTDGYCSVNLKIWNFSTTNPLKPYQGELPYNLKATLVKRVVIPGEQEGDPDTIVYQSITSDDLGTLVLKLDDNIFDDNLGDDFVWNATESAYVVNKNYTFSAVEGNYVSMMHEYVVRFPEIMLVNGNNIYVKLEAIPTNGDINLMAINGILGIQTEGATLSQGWTGYFSDNKNFTDYDAFNYVFTGNGAETITFKWCSNYLEVSQISLDMYNLTATSSTETNNGVSGIWKTVTINANANTGPNRYDFQLYMTGNPARNYGDPKVTYETNGSFWKVVESYVYDNLPK